MQHLNLKKIKLFLYNCYMILRMDTESSGSLSRFVWRSVRDGKFIIARNECFILINEELWINLYKGEVPIVPPIWHRSCSVRSQRITNFVRYGTNVRRKRVNKLTLLYIRYLISFCHVSNPFEGSTN